MVYSRRPKERPEYIAMQEEIRGRALYSLGILGKSFIYHGSGRFVDLRPPKKEGPRRINTKFLDDAVE